MGSLNSFFVILGIFLSQVLGLPQLLGTETLWPFLLGKYAKHDAILHSDLCGFSSFQCRTYNFPNDRPAVLCGEPEIPAVDQE